MLHSLGHLSHCIGNHHGLSKGSEPPLNPPNPPPCFGGFGATGVCVVEADVHPPKSSSAVTDGCLTGLLDCEIGAPHPPEMSFGVIRSGGLPKSTVGAAGLAGAVAGAGAPQGLLSLADDHGSNIGLLFAAGRLAGAGAGCEDRLNAELKALLGIVVGDETFGGDIAGPGFGADGAVPQPPKSSELNKSAGMFAAGFGTGAGAGFGAEGDVGTVF